ncbi:MAG: glycosyltransferase [Clostridia bacterium]|nr:glycosyltransferase [Clostridia bacterium]
MKIGIVIASLGFGGAEKVTISLTEYFISQGHDCIIYTTIRKKDEYTLPENVRRVNVTDGKSNSYFNRVSCIKNAVKRDMPDVIIVMGMPVTTYAIPACKGLNIPIISCERNDPYNFNGKLITKIFYEHFIKDSDAFIFQTEYAKGYYEDKIKEKSYTIIPNPINTKYVFERNYSEIKNTIANVGRLIPQKNQKMLIEAFSLFLKEYPDYTLEIFGSGSLLDELTDLTNSLGLSDKVFFMGTCEDVNRRIQNDSMFVLSSNFEGMPNALMEAMACSVPSISTDCPVGGPKEIITDGENGLLVEVNNAVKMAEAMKYYASDIDRANSIGEKGKQATERFSIDVIGKRWLSFIDSILNK